MQKTVDARNAKDGIAQLKSYMSVCPNCEWGMWTNSVQKYVFRKAVDAAGNITFMEYNDIPPPQTVIWMRSTVPAERV